MSLGRVACSDALGSGGKSPKSDFFSVDDDFACWSAATSCAAMFGVVDRITLVCSGNPFTDFEMFDGQDSRRRAIRLGGREREADKGELMKRARAERAERAEAKRRAVAAARLTAWCRGRWTARRHRAAVRLAFDGQMRDIDAVRVVFARRGARFELPLAPLRALTGAFVASWAGLDEVQLERMCTTLLQDRSSARLLSATQWRGVLEACMTAAEQDAAGLGWRRLTESACASLDDDAGLISRDTARLALVWVGPRACEAARARPRSAALALACASVAAAGAFDADAARHAASTRARAAFALRVLTVDGINDVVSATLASDLTKTCSAALGAGAGEAKGGSVLLGHVSRACEHANECPTDAVVLALALASRLPRASLVDDDRAASSLARASASQQLVADDQSDDDDDDDDTEVDSARSSQQIVVRKPRSSVMLLDASLASKVSARDSAFPQGDVMRQRSSALAMRSFWRGVFTRKDDDLLLACRLAATVIVACDPPPRARVAVALQRPRVVSALLDAANDGPLVRELWRLARTALGAVADSPGALEDHEGEGRPQRTKQRRVEALASPEEHPAHVLALSSRTAAIVVFCSVFSHVLAQLDDEALAAGESHLSRAEILEAAAKLRDALYREMWLDSALQRTQSLGRLYAVAVCARLVNQLYDRVGDAAPDAWLWPRTVRVSEQLAADDDGTAPEQTEDADGDADMTESHPNENLDAVALSKEPRVAQVLAAVPFAVPFAQRVGLFSMLVERNRNRHQDDAARFAANRPLGVRVTIRRDHVFDDAFEGLSDLSPDDLRGRIQVTFVTEDGHEEAGIDGGGVFKEFLDELAKHAFDESLFCTDPDDGALFPRPGADVRKIEFCGRVIGKALYERVLVEPRFAKFFLNTVLGKHNSFDDLKSLDVDLHRSLARLQRLSRDEIDALGLTFDFTSVDPITGLPRDIELVPGGSEIQVDASNRRKYAQLVAHLKLNLEAATATTAFLAGLRTFVPGRWLRMFDPAELQTLISGDDTPIDVDDMQAHVIYGGGYHPSQPYIQAFWATVHEFDPPTRAKLLRFVTSCSRPPLLGFARLRPLIAIHKVPDFDRLPTAGTCMNLLKLPQYADTDTLKRNLLLAIREASGFELS